MQVKEIVEVLDAQIPNRHALSWDNVGLLVGSEDWEVRRIYVALDATDEVIAHAVEWQADLIVTHHPMIFSGMKQVVASDFIGRKILTLAEHHIAVYAMHTNFDIHGMGDLADERLGLTHTEPLEICTEDGLGIGSIGDLDQTYTLQDYAKHVKTCFGLSSVKVFGNADTKLHRVAMVPGSGKSDIDTAIAQGADAMITGDVDHHAGIDAVDKGICVIDAGHYGIEHVFISYMAQHLQSLWKDIAVKEEPKKEPFYVV